MEDKQIVALFLARDQAAIARTQEKYGKLLLTLSHRITENREDADECVNDALLQAWQRIPPDCPAHLGAWLAKVTRHISLNVCQKRRAQKRSAVVTELSQELQACVPGPLDAVDWDNRALQDAINHFLQALDGSTRYIFVRRYFFGDTLPEIARRTGRSESNLASILFRARSKLRAQLSKEGIDL